MCVCIVIVVNRYGFTPWYSHCVIQATEPQPIHGPFTDRQTSGRCDCLRWRVRLPRHGAWCINVSRGNLAGDFFADLPEHHAKSILLIAMVQT